MIYQKLRRVGNSFAVTIPREEVERRGLREGQLLSVEVHPVEFRPLMSRELGEAFDASWEHNASGYRYLAER